MDRSSEKARLRKLFRARRDDLSEDELLLRSRKINENFLQNLLPKIYQKEDEKIFSLYLSTGHEVSTGLIAQSFQENKISFSYPRIIAKNQPLEFIRFQSETRFLANKFYSQILEPNEGEKTLPDFVILPLVAFDSDLSRLGMGGGFFDRTINFLKTKKSKIITVGLAFDFQGSNDPLPVENTDQKLDFIVTEKNLFSPSRIQCGSASKII
ncbi:MAG: 5-formyltetrahydrofolate cyclo-ligase [Proteobacteria bacterium]|nr:5-formyltetrahydrofolate cyclo-ligase [Pseudomonadota bacterium]